MPVPEEDPRPSDAAGAPPSAAGQTDPRRIGNGGRRSRMISFRVTDREFEELKLKAEAEGARNVSDFARMALCGASQAVAERIDKRMTEMSAEIQQLAVDIRRMAQVVGGPRHLAAGRAAAPSARKNGRH